jgi:hypothetical protein
VSDGLVVFESYDPAAATPNFDLYAYDLTDDELFRLTDTPEDESLNDVYVAPNGTATVAWSRHEATGDDDVFAEQFVVPDRTTSPTLVATVQPPIEPDGSSDFTANRVVPVKFALTVDGAPTCDLPPATMTVTRMGAPATQALVPTTFHVTDCQYQLNLNTRQLGPGTYVIGIVVNGHEVGAASFRLH